MSEQETSAEQTHMTFDREESDSDQQVDDQKEADAKEAFQQRLSILSSEKIRSPLHKEDHSTPQTAGSPSSLMILDESLGGSSLGENEATACSPRMMECLTKVEKALNSLYDGDNDVSSRTLELKFHEMGNEEAEELSHALDSNRDAMVHLNLLGNRRIGLSGWRHLSHALSVQTQLQTLSLSLVDMGDTGVIALASRFPNTLVSLDLSENAVSDKGAISLASWLASSGDIKELRLGHNNIGDVGAAKLAAALTKNTSLQTLDLSFNQIEGKGGRALAYSLKRNSTLQIMNLRHNRVESDGARLLAQALLRNKSLEELDLRANNIGMTASFFARTLRKNTSLRSLDLGENSLGTAGASALRHNTGSLRELKLDQNDIGYFGIAAIAFALKQRCR
jgi:hypothetical protein